MENLVIYWAGPDRLGGPRRTRKRSPDSVRPTLAPASASATDKGAPRDRETGRGGRKDGGTTRRRWQLRRGHRCYGVRLTRAHLVEPSIEAIATAKGNGDGHGGARPWLGRLRRDDGVMALVGDPTSFSSIHSTK